MFKHGFNFEFSEFIFIADQMVGIKNKGRRNNILEHFR